MGFRGSDIERVEFFPRARESRARLRVILISLFSAPDHRLPRSYGEQALRGYVGRQPDTPSFLTCSTIACSGCCYRYMAEVIGYYSAFPTRAGSLSCATVLAEFGLGSEVALQ